MMYEKLKEVLEKIENIDTILKSFKINVKNNVVLLEQDCEIDERDYGIPYSQMSDEQHEDFYFKWKYVSSNCIFNLYSNMGWSTSEFKKRTIGYSVDANCSYVNYYFSDAWDKINKLDNWKFFHAMITLVEGITDNKKQVYRYIKYPIEKFLSEYKLEHLIKGETKDVFIAMSFSEEMIKAKSSIKKALKECGYNAVIMDERDHNNQIVPEIYLQIRESKFAVIDLTQQKTGVYYEAGYAKAMEKEIIYLCKNDDFKNIHFDIAQQNVIKWDDEFDLQEKLEQRIIATVGKKYI
jgi:nucleoside 2-deoxyribosyltransferase